MKLNTTACPTSLRRDEITIGDVFATTKGTFNVIVAIRSNTAYCIVFGMAGDLRGSTQYGLHYFERRQRVGRVNNLPEELDVEWYV